MRDPVILMGKIFQRFDMELRKSGHNLHVHLGISHGGDAFWNGEGTNKNYNCLLWAAA